jgi:hypothetical protein
VSVHGPHESQPGHSPHQILHDGCEECADRANSRNLGLAFLDPVNFRRAWARAAEYNARGLPDLSMAERPMLDALWAVQCQLENYGCRIGHVPDMRLLHILSNPEAVYTLAQIREGTGWPKDARFMAIDGGSR